MSRHDAIDFYVSLTSYSEFNVHPNDYKRSIYIHAYAYIHTYKNLHLNVLSSIQHVATFELVCIQQCSMFHYSGI